MIADLPSHSRWVSWFHDPARGEEFRARFGLDDRDEDDSKEKRVNWYRERRFWNDDRILYAAILNRLQDLVVAVPHWKEGKEPELPTVGPPEWRGEEPRKKKSKKKPAEEVSVADVLAVFGYTGPPQMPSEDDPAEEYDGTTVAEALSVFGFRVAG